MNEKDDAVRTAEFVASVTTSTRSHLVLFWFPMLVFGVVSIGAAVVAVATDSGLVWPYWAVVGTMGGVATADHYRRSELAAGLVRSTVPYFAAVAFTAIGAFAAPFVVRDDPAWAIALWLGIGYAVFAWLERSWWIAGVAALLVGIGVVLIIIEISHETAWWSAISGCVLLTGAAMVYPRRLKL